MAKSLLVTSLTNANQADASTSYTPMASWQNVSTTEDPMEFIFRSAATLSKLRANVSVNTITDTSILRTRKAGANGGQTVSITASTTGEFIDPSGTDSMASGDTIAYEIVIPSVAGNQNLRIVVIDCTCLASSETFCRMTQSTATSSGLAASTTYYAVLQGTTASLTSATTEAYAQITSGTAGTLKNLCVYFQINSRASSGTDWGTSIGAGDGNLVVTAPASTTGIFEDTGGTTDSISVGSLINYFVRSGAGTGNILVSAASVELATTNAASIIALGNAAGSFANGFGAVLYSAIGGFATTPPTLEPNYRSKTTFGMTVSYLHGYVDTNTLNAGSTALWIFRVGTTSTALRLSIPGGSTGVFLNTTDSYSPSVGAAVAYRIENNATSGNISYKNISILVTDTDTYAATRIKDVIQYGGTIPKKR